MSKQTPSRSGNALLISVGLVGMMATLIAASTAGATYAIRESNSALNKQRAIAALEAVLARREQMVIALGNRGDPAEFARWKANFGIENYGVDYVGGCEVRWRIEPVRTVSKNGLGEDIRFITNPSPSAKAAVTGDELPNEYIYLFRVAAEASVHGPDKFSDGEAVPIARAQGVRYSSVQKKPLFRYVIFYAQPGAKGDLELSHGDDAVIRGDVHSNGSIYVGSSTLVNSWGAISPFDGKTQIGPDAAGKPVFVTGVEGVFRLSKPLMYGALNKAIDPTWSGLAMTGVAPSGWTAGGAYSLSGDAYPLDSGVLDRTSVATATRNGSMINPYRIQSASGFVTKALSGADDKRTINTTPLIGEGASANDSRDGERTAKWNPSSLGSPPGGFSGQVRTSETNAVVTQLDAELTQRPLEAQRLREVDTDGDVTTDEHQAAQPLFETAGATGSNALPGLPATGSVVESIGKYLSHGLGTKDGEVLDQRAIAMTRRPNGTGWDVTDLTGAALTANQSTVGLVIRERPVPETAIWPGASAVPVVDPSSPYYMPFAYGKHWRPTTQPFMPMDITAHTTVTTDAGKASYSGWATINATTDNSASDGALRDFDLTSSARAERYNGAGSFTVRSAVSSGPNYPAGHSPANFASNRMPFFAQENWRFIHLKRPAATATAGLVATYWSDPYSTASMHDEFMSNAQQTTLSGPAALRQIETVVNTQLAPAGVNPDYFSVRWEGFVTPVNGDKYTFGVWADDLCRVFVNGIQVVSQPGYVGALGPASITWGKEISLNGGTAYHVVVEQNDQSGGEGAVLYWRTASLTAEVIPAARFRTRGDNFGFDWATFTAVQGAVVVKDVAAVPAQAKFGIMVRPAEGCAPIQNGRDPYIAALFSPTRGFFTQRRQAPSRIDGGKRTVYLNFVGSTNAASPTAADAQGQLAIPMGATDPVRRALLTPPAAWTTTLGTVTTNSVSRSSTRIVTTNTPSSITYGSKTNVPTGDGYFLDNVRTGPVGGLSLKVSKQRQMRSATYTTKTQTRTGILNLNLSNHVGLFVPSDATTKRIRFYTNPMGTTEFTNWDPNAWVYVSGTQIRRTWTTQDTRDNAAANPWANFGTPSELTSNFGNDTVIYPPLPRKVNAAGAVIPGTLTPTDVCLYMKAQDGRTYTYSATLPSYPTPPDPAAGVVPAETGTVATPNPAAIADPWGGTVSRTFCVERDNTKTVALQDVNPYVATGTPWQAALVNAFLPWSAIWTAASIPLSITPVPQTGSFPPHIWNLAARPLRIPWDASTSAAMTGLVNHSGRWAGDVPATWSYDSSKFYVVRIEKDTAAATPTMRAKYYIGTTSNPLASDPGWVTMPGTIDVSSWLAQYRSRTNPLDQNTMQLLIGLCVQSGDKTKPVEADFQDVVIERSAGGNINGAIWDTQAGGARDLSKYLASQYQVFWGMYDITEDFFSYGEATTASRLAREDWFYNPREFWSQSRWWDDAQTIQKDPPPTPIGTWDTFKDTTYRQLFAKTTLLTLNMSEIQKYLRDRTQDQAVARPMSGATPPVLATAEASAKLAERFNGMFYAARTNRFPWNPNPVLPNPYSPPSRPLPNSGATATDAVNTAADKTLTWTGSPLAIAWNHDFAGVNLLQPYQQLPLAPAFRPQDFHHGVRVINGSDINWGYPASGPTPKFGTSKSAIVTPNALFVQGNLNTQTHTVEFKGATVAKETPLAIMGDSIVLLSGDWRDENYQTSNLAVTNSSPGYNSGTGGALTINAGTAVASTLTTYNTAILTHNQPTTKSSVREGQGAPFIDTMMFMEAWPTSTTVPTMQYKGSLVVMNSRRYTRAFLLDSAKTAGRTPFGTTGWQKSPPDWLGQTPTMYAAPTRGFDFNEDLKTEEGTPPFTPFGVTASGVGGWSRILR